MGDYTRQLHRGSGMVGGRFLDLCWATRLGQYKGCSERLFYEFKDYSRCEKQAPITRFLARVSYPVAIHYFRVDQPNVFRPLYDQRCPSALFVVRFWHI